MENKQKKSTGRQYAVLAGAFLCLILFERIPFERCPELINSMDRASAWLCERFLNGCGYGAVERFGSHLRSLNPAHPFQLDFQDGRWLMKQFSLLGPLFLSVLAFTRLSLKTVITGFAATGVCLCLRIFGIGVAAVHWGDQAATGWFDGIVRSAYVLCVMFFVASAAAPRDQRPSD